LARFGVGYRDLYDVRARGSSGEKAGVYTSRSSALSQFIGNDASVRAVLETLHLVADTDATVLIIGETGTGKEVIARALHEESSRRDKPFIAINCGAVPDSLLESELFGHIRGSFTGATETRPGKFEAANGGIVFLDEVADMNHGLQVKLLRVLQTGEYSPVGSAATRACDVRVVAASNQPLKPLIASGAVRADLYYRLNVVSLDLPPLRARRGDIPLLLDHFLQRFAASYKRGDRRFSAEAERVLLSYDYPGNVRELENAVRRAVILCRGDKILPSDLPREMWESAPPTDTTPSEEFHVARAKAIEEFERKFLVASLRDCGGIVSRAAQRAGLSERNLHAKLKKHGLRGRDFRIPKVRAG
jgi:DNA-binding NtrC family response regulator